MVEPLVVLSTLATHTSQIGALQDDRKRQNGTLERLEAKIDGLILKILVALGASLLASGGWILVLLKH